MFSLKELESAVEYLKKNSVTQFTVDYSLTTVPTLHGASPAFIKFIAGKETVTLFDEDLTTIKVQPKVTTTRDL